MIPSAMYKPLTSETYKTDSLSEPSHQLPKSVISRDFPPHSAAASQLRKRKYDEITGLDDIADPFRIPASSESLSETAIFVPRLIVPRSCLPLAFLDVNGTSGDLQGNQIFSANISSLETSQPDEYTAGPNVLIAESAVTPCLYAVERVRHGTYAICKLCARVTLKDLEELVMKAKACPKRRRLEKVISTGDKWWHQASALAKEAAQISKSSDGKPWVAAGFELCLNAPAGDRSLAVSSPKEISEEVQQEQAFGISGSAVQEISPQEKLRDANEMFNMIRTQYQEALYMSQTSLAYFAKGPLSRARAFFLGTKVSMHDRRVLPGFLRSCILSLPIMDKKYGETVPNLVKELPMAALSDDENAVVDEALRKKPRKSKKFKIGKNGLYPEEELKISRWWISRKTAIDVQDVGLGGEESTRARTMMQRAREIQLQIILILEVLALEISISVVKSETVPSEAIDEDRPGSGQKQKSKKPKDLNILLDLLVDRLCIWQSMDADVPQSSPDRKIEASQKKSGEPGQTSRLKNLRGFYVDVLLPFYGARLPVLCKMLCQKFGGPKQHSPARPPLVKAATSGAILRPGAPVHRLPGQKSRRTLERVLTDEKIVSRRPTPSLSRSATDSILPGLKREGSVVSLYSIPSTKVDVQTSRRYSQREVDLSAATQAHEVKLKRKANVEKELQSAITALKKPNPRMAVKEFVEAAERRAATMKLQKPKILGRNLSARRVQVIATPSVNRRKDVFGVPSALSRAVNTAAEVEEVPPSSAIRAVSCTPRAGVGATKCGIGQLPAPYEQTPTRGPLKHAGLRPNMCSTGKQAEVCVRPSGLASKINAQVPFLSGEGAPQFRPLSLFSSSTVRTPTKVRPTDSQRENSNWEIDDTPIKVLHDSLGTRQEFSHVPNAVDENSISIYDSLGWNDDIDELA